MVPWIEKYLPLSGASGEEMFLGMVDKCSSERRKTYITSNLVLLFWFWCCFRWKSIDRNPPFDTNATYWNDLSKSWFKQDVNILANFYDKWRLNLNLSTQTILVIVWYVVCYFSKLLILKGHGREEGTFH